jgi:cell wall-associated NlpC family hydrolase
MGFLKNIAKLTAFSGIFVILGFSSASALTVGNINGNNVNIRSEASVDSEVITKYNKGQTISIEGKTGNFYIINIDDAKLFVSEEFVDILRTKGTVTGENVNIRISPDTDADIYGKAAAGCQFDVIDNLGEWLKVDYFGDEGYISRQYIEGELIDEMETSAVPAAAAVSNETNETQQNKYAVVTSNTGLKLRNEPSVDAEVLGVLQNGDAVDVIDDSMQEWAKVSFGGTTAYLSKEFIAIGYGEKPVRENSLGNQMIEFGKQFLGTPYVWAGTNLNSGVDCSGFVYSVFKNFGISLNRSSRDMVRNGTQISKDQLQAGDLVFFDTTGVNDGGISHVGIYMDNGNFIHSSSSKRTWGVTISSLNEDYYIRTYVTAARVLK